MRNLRNIRHSKLKFEDEQSAGLTATAWDAADDSLILAFGPSESNPSITLKRLPADAEDARDTIPINSWDAASPNPSLAVDRILDLHCFPDTKTISLILAGGDVVIVHEDPPPGKELPEIVGSVDAGINAAAWSPDEELLAVSTCDETVLFMTRDFESIANIRSSSEDLKVSNHVSVGWGKKETQFKGRGVAKTLRDPTVPEHVDEGTLSPSDDGEVTISWRGDGQYLAISSILDVEPKRRIIRVYSREGTLESVSEPVTGLEKGLAWKPSGQIIAGIQRQDDDINVVFFERNGLRHGEFSLRLGKEEIGTIGSRINLEWNIDSTVLAVSMKDRVQLWTMGNYHYYLKQDIRLDTRLEFLARTLWHPEKPLHLCSFSNIDLRRLSYRLDVCRGSVSPPHDIGIVAVIDGKQLKVTPLRTANIPPPMAFDEIELPENAIDVAINEEGNELAVLHNGSISQWQCDYTSKPVRRAILLSHTSIPHTPPEQGVPFHELSNVAHFTIPVSENTHIRTDHDRIHYHKLMESILESRHPSVDSSNPSKIVWRNDENGEVNFHLSDNGVLHMQSDRQTIRLASCTSFIVTPTYLIYTTGQHLLKFVHMYSGDLEIPPDEPEKDERCRSIERGARIVTVVPSAYSLILQMPRGNLETIYPRALVLAGIRRCIVQREYKNAFSICRTHRVDMNILHDYMPGQFMRDIELFLVQLNKVEYVDLFLSSLSEVNVSDTIYRQSLAIAPGEPVINTANATNGEVSQFLTSDPSKVNKICDATLSVLHKQSEKRLQNIVTAHVCKIPPDLEAGLRLISGLRADGHQENLEQAVEHICFLADVNQLYDTALGIYDLDVALLVAQQSQKDPREYLPYLQQLHDMDPLRRCFAIDDGLRRYGKSIAHLRALDAFDELKKYTIQHELYSTAIHLYRHDNARLKELMCLYADHLSTQNKFKEAGIAYEYISDHFSAHQAFRAAGMWQECLANAALVPLPPNDLLTVAQDLASSLEEAKDFRSAATIRLEHLNDVEGGAHLLCKGHHFAEGIRQVLNRQQPELLKKVIDPSLIEAFAAMTEQLAEMNSQVAAQIYRLRELRQKKAEDPIAFLDGEDGGDVDVPDNLSLAPTDASTTGGTFMTRYTNHSMGTLATNATRKTSKNRRREERKRARGKKGTVYEEEYLINSIARLIERLNEVSTDAASMVEALMRRTMREQAVAVQAAVDEVSYACRGCMKEVFGPVNDVKDREPHDSAHEETLPRPWGGQGVLWDALTASKREAPMLKSFERLSLIG